MVQEIQSTDEFYLDDYLPLDFAPNDAYDSDEQFVILMCLLLLKEYYEEYSKTPLEDLINTIEKDMEELNTKLSTEGMEYIKQAVDKTFSSELDSYKIPENTISPNYNELVILAGFQALVNQLRDDLKAKALYYAENLGKTPFDLKPNFRRAIKGLMMLLALVWFMQRRNLIVKFLNLFMGKMHCFTGFVKWMLKPVLGVGVRQGLNHDLLMSGS